MVKVYALSSLQQIGPAARAATPLLIEIVTHPRTNGYMVRYLACRALLDVNPDSALSVPAFIKCLEDRHELVRAGAADCLGFLGTNARPAIPALLQLVEASGNDPQVRFSAQMALGKIGPAAATNAFVSASIHVDER
jgi:HEAT repeat protein